MAIKVSTSPTGRNPYNTYLDLSRAEAGMDADIAQGVKLRQAADQKKSRDLQLAKLKAQDIQGLMISSDTEYESLQNYEQSMSRQLVDQYSGLVNSLENQEISQNEFATASAKINSQVPQIKQLIGAVNGVAVQYATGLSEGSLSKAITPEQEQYYQAIINNRGNFGMDDNGVLVFQGKTEDGESFSIPANKIDQMPQPIQRAPSFESLLGPVLTKMAVPERRQLPNGQEVVRGVMLESPEFEKTVRSSFDTFLEKNGGEMGLKSLAADYMGYTHEQINADINSGQYEGPNGEIYSSKLEYDVEEKYSQMAVDNYIVKQQTNWKQQDYDLKLQKMQQIDANRAAQMQMAGSEKERNNMAKASILKKLPPPTKENLSLWLDSAGLQGSKNISIAPLDQTDGKIVLVKGGKLYREITQEMFDNPEILARYLSGAVYGVDSSKFTPKYNIKSSPVQKLKKFLTRKK